MIRHLKKFTKEDYAKILSEEYAFLQKNKDAANNDLIEYLINCADLLGRPPKRHEVVGFMLIKNRFGPWPRVLEKAGLKEKSQRQLSKETKGSIKQIVKK